MYGDALKILNSELPLLGEADAAVEADASLQKEALAGMIYARLHQFPEAEMMLDRAMRHSADPNNASLGEVFTAKGYLDLERGEFGSAKESFERSRRITRSRKNQFLDSLASLNIGYCALRQEHFDEAVDFFTEATNVAGTVDARMIVATAQGNLGWAYYKIGDIERALELSKDAYQRAYQLGSAYDQVAWLTNIGLAHLDQQKFAIAEEYYKRAYILGHEINSKQHLFEATVPLAFVELRIGKINDAAKYNDEALALARATGNRRDELYPLLVKAAIAARQHDPPKAEALFREVANDPKVDPSLKWEALHELASLYQDVHRPADAEKTYTAALAELEAARDSLHREESKLPFLTNGTRLYDDYIHFLISQGKTVQALQVADHSRAQTLAEGLGVLKKSQALGNAAFRPAVFNPQQVARSVGGTALFYWLGPRQSYLWAVTRDRTELFQLPPEAEIDAAVEGYRKALLGPRDPLEAPNADGRKLYDMLVAPAQTLIPPQSRVLVLADGSLNKLNFETLIAPGDGPEMASEEQIPRTFSLRKRSSERLGMTNGKKVAAMCGGTSSHPNFVIPRSTATRNLLFHSSKSGPLPSVRMTRVRGGARFPNFVIPRSTATRNLLFHTSRSGFLPSAGMTRVKEVADRNDAGRINILPANPKPHYWIEDVSVTNAASLRLATNSRKAAPAKVTPAKTAKLLLIGDPVSPDPTAYPELHNASAEIDGVGKHFEETNRQVFSRAEATAPTYLAARPEQYAYVHFVAHGTASRRSPLDSAIVLSKASAQEDSFKLYAREIIQHPLRADLVTISACYGSGSRAYTGEGLVGLSWAFLRAGAHNVIGALWEVSDRSTPQLMDQLYRELRQGRPPDAALRNAKLAMLHSDSQFRRPFYWAPFQLYLGS